MKNERRCIKCGDILNRKKGEGERDWNSRQFCNRACYLGNRSVKPIWKTFVEKTNILENGCIEWTGYKDKKGYGRFSSAGGEVLAHRLSFTMHYGADILGVMVLHRCDNPSCVNPQHLFLGNNSDNMADMVRKKRSSKRYGSANPNWRHGNNCKNKIEEGQ